MKYIFRAVFSWGRNEWGPYPLDPLQNLGDTASVAAEIYMKHWWHWSDVWLRLLHCPIGPKEARLSGDQV